MCYGIVLASSVAADLSNCATPSVSGEAWKCSPGDVNRGHELLGNEVVKKFKERWYFGGYWCDRSHSSGASCTQILQSCTNEPFVA